MSTKYYSFYSIGDLLKDKKTKECWLVVASYCQPSVFSSVFEVKKDKFKFKLLDKPKSLDVKCYYLLSMKGNGMKAICAAYPNCLLNFKQYKCYSWSNFVGVVEKEERLKKLIKNKTIRG